MLFGQGVREAHRALLPQMVRFARRKKVHLREFESHTVCGLYLPDDHGLYEEIHYESVTRDQLCSRCDEIAAHLARNGAWVHFEESK